MRKRYKHFTTKNQLNTKNKSNAKNQAQTSYKAYRNKISDDGNKTTNIYRNDWSDKIIKVPPYQWLF